MKKSEIAELLRLKGWSKTRLAAELHITEAGVYKWFREGGAPDGPVSILLRLWLDNARHESANKHEAVPA